MLSFSTGSGFSTAMVIESISKWLAGHGLTGRSANLLYARLSSGYGASRFRVHRGNLEVQRNGAWQLVVHRDDLFAYLYGREVPIKVGKAPDPAERGVKVQVGVMEASIEPGDDGKLGTKDDEVTIKPTLPKKIVVEYEEIQNSKGETIFRCTACGLRRKDEQVVIAHIERSH